jgi:predicted MFS family arabinose efflux permease
MASLSDTASQALQRVEARSADVAGGRARLYIGLLLGAAYGLDAADKAAISAVAGPIEKAFSIGHLQIGILIAAVSFVGAVFTLPAGVLIDRSNRRTVMLAAMALWTAAMVISGTATSFIFMLVARLFLGAVTAAVAPAVASLVGDFIPAQARTRVYAIILSGELVGTGLGFLLAGEVSSFLDWRWSLYLMGVPSAAVMWAIWRFLPEPARGGQSWIRLGQRELPEPGHEDAAHGTSASGRPAEPQERGRSAAARPRELVERAGIAPRHDLVLDAEPNEWSLWHAMRYLLRIPTYRLLIIASSLSYYFFSGARAFGMIYLTQHYGLSRSTVSALALIVGIGAIAGLFGGGRLSERLLARGWLAARIVVPGVALLSAAILFAPAIVVASPIVGVALLTCGTAALAAANPPIDAARLDVVPARLWGRGEAGRMALRGLLEGGAPLLVGAMAGWLGGGASGLEWTLLIMLAPVVAASALAIPARRTYPRDVATAEASMQKRQPRRH